MSRKMLALLLLMPLGACAAPAADTPTFDPPSAGSPTVAPTSTPAPTRPPHKKKPPAHPKKPLVPPKKPPVPPKKPAAPKARHAGSDDPLFGTQYARLKSGRAATRQITYDLIYWYDGRQAVKACQEDGRKPSENDYCTGWYIRNNNPKLRTLTLDPGAPISIDDKDVDLRTFLRYESWGTVIRFDVDGGRITRLERIYTP
ncbi:hypothetical protein [Actinoplanes sp. NPDC051411]|uniref:hypothetical protein n=1 Tax=Actinoplanes sp. NPDC051411 TaxID=3155522 RepID=UPI003428F079